MSLQLLPPEILIEMYTSLATYEDTRSLFTASRYLYLVWKRNFSAIWPQLGPRVFPPYEEARQLVCWQLNITYKQFLQLPSSGMRRLFKVNTETALCSYVRVKMTSTEPGEKFEYTHNGFHQFSSKFYTLFGLSRFPVSVVDTIGMDNRLFAVADFPLFHKIAASLDRREPEHGADDDPRRYKYSEFWKFVERVVAAVLSFAPDTPIQPYIWCPDPGRSARVGRSKIKASISQTKRVFGSKEMKAQRAAVNAYVAYVRPGIDIDQFLKESTRSG